ncbi:MAG: replicative DNA helicase, partial [Anaerolineae bacterium]|nr:replicative DNA helicase [Anaerolineae bacterium]
MTDQDFTRTPVTAGTPGDSSRDSRPGRDLDSLNLAPHSVEAEEAVLGSILMNPEALHEVRVFLAAEDFFILRHGWIYEAILRLAERDDAIDARTLAEELRAQERLEDVGGEAYLNYLPTTMPTALNAEVYAHIVERAAIRRRLLGAAGEIARLAHDQERDINEVIDTSESTLFTVTEQRLRQELVPMQLAVSRYFDRIEELRESETEALGVPTGFLDLDKLLGGLQKSDLVIIAGRPGMGKCVAEGTLIATERGLLPIETLKPQGVLGQRDDEGGLYYPLEIGVQTPEGLRSTSHFYDSGIRPTKRFTTRAGYSLTGTYVHPVLVLNSEGQKEWKRLQDLQVGDYVAVQRHAPVFGEQNTIQEFEFYKSGFTAKPDLPDEMTPELAYFLGLLTGDGCLTSKNYVKLSSADSDIIDEFYAWAHRLGVNARHNKAYDHTIGSVVLNTWLGHLGLSGYAHEKQIPECILSASQDCTRSYIQGLFDTDGHAEAQRGYLQFASASEVLIRQLHLLLLQFGIVAKLTFKANNFRGSWGLRLTGNNARLFYDRIGFRLERKQRRCQLLPKDANSNLDVVPYLPERQSSFTKAQNFTRYFRGARKPTYGKLQEIAAYAPEVQALLEPQYYWDEVKSIEDAGLQHCYDLTVPDGHAFVANGIVSHNTSFMLSLAMNAARHGNARIAIFSMEMSNEQLVQRMISTETGISSQDLRLGRVGDEAWARFVEATGSMSNLKIYLDDSPAVSAMQLRTKCRRLYREHGLDLIIVDYLQLMNAGRSLGRDTNRVQEITYISRALKELARELNVPLLSAAQLSRAVEQRQDKRPQLSDL